MRDKSERRVGRMYQEQTRGGLRMVHFRKGLETQELKKGEWRADFSIFLCACHVVLKQWYIFFEFWCGSVVIICFVSEKRSQTSSQRVCGSCPTSTSKSQTPAICLRFQLNSDTVYVPGDRIRPHRLSAQSHKTSHRFRCQ